MITYLVEYEDEHKRWSIEPVEPDSEFDHFYEKNDVYMNEVSGDCFVKVDETNLISGLKEGMRQIVNDPRHEDRNNG